MSYWVVVGEERLEKEASLMVKISATCRFMHNAQITYQFLTPYHSLNMKMNTVYMQKSEEDY